MVSSASVAQERAPSAPEALLDKMTGQWVLTGTIAKGIAYEAWIYIVWDAKAGEYAVMWLDNTAATNFSAEGVGHAKPDGDRIPIVYKFGDGSGIRTTFAYDRRTDTWSWLIDNVDKSGKASPFANVTLTRKK